MVDHDCRVASDEAGERGSHCGDGVRRDVAGRGVESRFSGTSSMFSSTCSTTTPSPAAN
jgi:hypothetical protein